MADDPANLEVIRDLILAPTPETAFYSAMCIGDQLPRLFLSATAALLLCNCGSSDTKSFSMKDSGINVAGGSSATPPHRMSRYEYPFDAEGNYQSTWAAEGERRAGRSAINRTRSSHSSSRKKSSSSRTSYRYHKVTSGDTLWGLSRKYDTSVSSIKKANGMKSDTIRTGSTLKIPK